MIRPTCIGILLSVGILVSGCGSQGTRVPDSPITRAPEQGGWFCQMSASGDGWSCVRDQALADDLDAELLCLARVRRAHPSHQRHSSFHIAQRLLVENPLPLLHICWHW